MSSGDQLKVLIGLASAFAGWMLAQFTGIAKAWFYRRKIKRLLLEELRDIDLETHRLLMSYSRQLQMYGAKCIDNNISVGISNFIFKNYYKDALLSLNQRQRISYQMIHSLVDQVNVGISELRDLTTQIQNENLATGVTERIAKAGVSWGEKVKAEYQQCALLQWQVRFHIQHQTGPDLSGYTEHHKNYVKYAQSVEEEANKVIESGVSIDPERFRRVYNAESFPRNAAP